MSNSTKTRYNEDSEDTKTVIREEKFLDEDKKPCRRLTIIDSNQRHGYYQEQDDQGNWRMFGRYSRGEIFSDIIPMKYFPVGLTISMYSSNIKAPIL